MDYRKTALKKMSKLLYLLSYSGDIISATPCTITPPIHARELPILGMNQPAQIHSGAKELIDFLQIHRTYFYPSNTGSWTADIGYFLLCLSNEIGQHLGQAILRSPPFHSLQSIISLTNTNTDTPSSSTLLSTFQIDSVTKNLQDTSLLHSSPVIHQATMKYLCGSLTSIALEGLYGKSPFMIQSCNFCLRNLCAVDPSLGHVIIPFLLASLHPDAVNQSHMAPSSMTAITHIFKPLIYPEPVFLPYLGELLQLSLAGIDPNDTQKTMTTLAMYNSIFTWIPKSTIGLEDLHGGEDTALDSLIPPHYLDLTSGSSTSSASTSNTYAIAFNTHLSTVIISWYPKFLEKIFNLLNSKEKPTDTKSSKQASPTTAYIEESFYEIVSCLTPKLRLFVTESVLDYATTSHATNAIKEIGKMLENLISMDPSLLSLVLDKIIDTDLVTRDSSTEKMALKIRLIGACVRRAGGDNIRLVFSKLQFLYDEEFKHHSEKVIRKAICKFYKDVLKGLASFYVLCAPAESSYEGTSLHILGRPSHAEIVKVLWHIPSTESVTESVKIMKLLASTSMTAVESLLSENTTTSLVGNGGNSSDDQSLSLKKIEEKIVTHLQIIRRCLRGAAEMLGDESSPAVVTEAISCEDETTADEDMDVEENQTSRLIETGRAAILNSLSPDDKLYLETIRHSVVSFLNRIYFYLNPTTVTPTTNITTTAITISSTETPLSFHNNPSIHSLWMKIFGVTTMLRMSILKTVDQVKKWFSLSKRMIKSSTSTYMEKKLQRIQFSRCRESLGECPTLTGTERWDQAIQSAEYWIGHDLSSRSVGDRAWIQLILREKELSYQSIFNEQRKYQTRSEYVVALSNIAKICGHEYDAIRSKAIKIFKEVSSRFGSSLETLLRPLLSSISATGTSYPNASGALSVMSLDLVQKRICGNASLSALFLRSVRAFPILLNSIPEPDKREKLANKMSSVFAKFLSSWHHIPLQEWTSQSKAPMSSLLIQFLGDFGVKNTNDINGTTLTNSDPSTSAGVDDSVIGIGLRQQLYLASSILIFVGHDDIELPLGVWDWAISTVSNAHGQPIQLVSLAALTKLATIEYRKSLFDTSSCSSSSSSQSNIRHILSTLFNSTEACFSFLNGLSLSHVHSHGGSNNAQWSKGVDHMLRNSEYIRNVLPRTETSYCDLSVFSNQFKLSNAAMVMQLLSLSTTRNAEGVNVESLTMAIGNLLQTSKSIPSTSEEEMRGANTVRAEVFSGVARFLRQEETMGLSGDITESLWKEILSFFNENISKVSQDYCSDWAEGVAFAFNGSPNLPTNPVCDSLLRSIQQLFLSAAATTIPTLATDATNDGSPTTSSELSSTGFAKDTKTLLLVRALLISDISTVSRSNNFRFIPKGQQTLDPHTTSSSKIGLTLLSFLSQASSTNLSNSVFVSPYLSIRMEMSKLFVRLVDVEIKEVSLSPLLKCVLYGCEHSQIHGNTPTPLPSSSVGVALETSVSEVSSASSSSSSGEGMPLITEPDLKQTVTDTWKLSCDIASRCLERLHRSSFFQKYQSALCPLLKIVLEGCGHYELEFSKLCHQICLKTSESLKFNISTLRCDGEVVEEGQERDVLSKIIHLFTQQMKSSSLHIRETVIICLGIIFINNYPLLTFSEKKLCKEVFAEGLHDAKPEVQVLSIVAMTTYLSIKPIDELTTLAASYVKNSDILATRSLSHPSPFPRTPSVSLLSAPSDLNSCVQREEEKKTKQRSSSNFLNEREA
jgi:hypothetical protein